MTDWTRDELLDFERDFSLPEQGEDAQGFGNPPFPAHHDRAAWEASRPTRQERAARSFLRPRTGLIEIAPVRPPTARGNT